MRVASRGLLHASWTAFRPRSEAESVSVSSHWATTRARAAARSSPAWWPSPGTLVVAGAIGTWWVLQHRRGGRWGPVLFGVFGDSLIVAGVFVADPALGFPPGAPSVPPAELSGRSAVHFIAGGVGFPALVAACFVFARAFAALGRRGWAGYSVVTGVLFGAGFIAIATASMVEGIALVFSAAVVLVWAWVSATSAALITNPPSR